MEDHQNCFKITKTVKNAGGVVAFFGEVNFCYTNF